MRQRSVDVLIRRAMARQSRSAFPVSERRLAVTTIVPLPPAGGAAGAVAGGLAAAAAAAMSRAPIASLAAASDRSCRAPARQRNRASVRPINAANRAASTGADGSFQAPAAATQLPSLRRARNAMAITPGSEPPL